MLMELIISCHGGAYYTEMKLNKIFSDQYPWLCYLSIVSPVTCNHDPPSVHDVCYFPSSQSYFQCSQRICWYCVLARLFNRSRLCGGSSMHTGTFGRGDAIGRSLKSDLLALDFHLALSIIRLLGIY